MTNKEHPSFHIGQNYNFYNKYWQVATILSLFYFIFAKSKWQVLEG
jgi:hypothetical protein